MAVTVAGTSTSSSTINGPSLTFAWNNSASADMLLVGVSSVQQTTPTGITYAGAALTQIGAQNSTSNRVSIWFKANPAAGNNNVVVSYAADTSLSGGATGFSGSDTT